MGAILKIDFKGTPLWGWVRGYYIRNRHDTREAEQYLTVEVPEQFHHQIRRTLQRMQQPRQKENGS